MTMLDQITTGVYAAIQHAPADSALAVLTDNDADALIAQVIAALSRTPDDSPAPTLNIIPEATPVLTISPADVVAMAARNAFAQTDFDAALHGDAAPVIEETWAAGEDYREFREYVFAVQALFGVRVRSFKTNDTPLFRVAGTETQIRAFQQTVMLMHGLAQPVVSAFLDPEDRRAFWATLGNLATAESDDAEALIEDNRAAFAAATDYLNDTHGRARTLPRRESATSGAVYERAAAVMNTVEARP